MDEAAALFFTWLRAAAHPDGKRIERLELVKLTDAQEDRSRDMLAALLLAYSIDAAGATVVVNAAPAPVGAPASAATGRASGDPSSGAATATPMIRWPHQVNGLCRLCNVGR